MTDLTNKVIITVATTGAVTTRSHTPYVPITPEEIANEIITAYHAGAAIAHIHVRDDQGNACLDLDKTRQVIEIVQAECDIVINLTSAGGVNLNEDDRIKPVTEFTPELATFDAGTINWRNETIFENNPKFLERLATVMQEIDVKPEIEIFDSGMLRNVEYLQRKGFLTNDSHHFQFVLGVPSGAPATVDDLLFLKNKLPTNATWSAFGVGKNRLPIMLTTLALGGHLRVGMEDNIFIRKDVLAEKNAEFVEEAVQMIRIAGKEVATPNEARQILGINKK